jgi:hypothetical protein
MHRFVLGLVVLLAGCTQSIRDEAVSFCQPFCRCLDSPLPAEQRDCNATCQLQFQRDPLSQACTECVIDHADRCTALLDECTDICNQAVPLQLFGRTESGIEDGR